MSDSIYRPEVNAAFPASGVRVHETVAAPAVDSSHLTGVTYAAVRTTVTRHPVRSGVSLLTGAATDGNGRTTRVRGIDSSLGLAAQHLQVLQAHHAGQNVRDYLPGYLDMGSRLDGSTPESSTLVWVLS
jgi:hypothetical protein